MQSVVIDENLAKVSWLEAGRGRTFYAIGGTWRALAKLHMEAVAAPLRVMHGYRVRRGDMIAFCDRFQKPRQLAEIRGYSSDGLSVGDVVWCSIGGLFAVLWSIIIMAQGDDRGLKMFAISTVSTIVHVVLFITLKSNS